MSAKTKLIWDFRGPEAKHIAEHHAKHLKEFAEARNLNNYECGTQEHSGMFASAFIRVEEKDAAQTRDALRPHRQLEE